MSAIAKNNKPILTFGDAFWTKIRDELRIYVIQEKRPNKILKLYELGEEDVGVDRKKIKVWSPQAESLVNEIMEYGYADFICNRDHIREVFKTLNFVKLQIKEIDPELVNFPNLQVLDLSQNLITTIENLPKSIKELRLFSNSITSISIRLKPCENILYLGLGWNKLKDEGIINIHRFFPSLMSLDVSNNLLEDIELVLSNVEKLPKLKMLNAYGNPICLLPGYRSSFIYAIQNLEIIDNKRIEPSDRLSANDFPGGRATTASSKSVRVQNSLKSKGKDGVIEEDDLQDARSDALNKKKKRIGSAFTNNEGTQIIPQHEFKFRMAIQTLENLPDGLILEKSGFPRGEEKSEYFQTSYFCVFDLGDVFSDPLKNKIDSRPKAVERLHRVREQKVQERLYLIQKQEEEQKKQQELLAQQQQQQQAQGAKKGAKAPPPPKNAPKDASKVEIPPEIPPVNTNLEGRAMIEDTCKDDDVSRLDMQIDFEEIFTVTARTRDFFRNGIIVRLFKSEPLMVLPEGGQPDDEKQPKMNPETNLPELVETEIGQFKIDLNQFLENGQMPRISNFKYSIFEENMLKIPEYHFPLENEKQLLMTNAQVVQQLLQQQEDAEKPPEPEAVDPKKKDAKKKEVKKQDKKAPAKKGGKDEPEKKTVALSTFPTHQRQQIFQDKDHIYLSVRKLQIAALVEIVQ